MCTCGSEFIVYTTAFQHPRMHCGMTGQMVELLTGGLCKQHYQSAYHCVTFVMTTMSLLAMVLFWVKQ